MITKVFAVYDLKALAFGVPFFMPSVGSAVRAFGDISNDKQSAIGQHPSDYVLFQVGEFDDSKGVLLPLSPHVHLGIASDFVSVVKVPALDKVSRLVESPLASTEEALNGGSR